MATISIFESLTVDGVMQGPGRADEDSRGGFVHGGWADGYTDEVAMQAAGEEMARSVAMLFGHRTYDDLLAYWTGVSNPNPFTEALVNAPSTSLPDPSARCWPTRTPPCLWARRPRRSHGCATSWRA